MRRRLDEMDAMPRALPGQQRSRLPALLAIAACLGLALLNWRMLNMDIDTSPIAPGGAGGEAALAQAEGLTAEPGMAANSAFPETLARPLFRANRRPPDPKKPEVAAVRPSQPQIAAKLPDGLALVGIIKEGGVERALLRAPGSEQGQWVGIGYVVDGWRLSRIESGSVTFEAGGRKQALSLFPQRDEAPSKREEQSAAPAAASDDVGKIRRTVPR
jgi:hypothetical protein